MLARLGFISLLFVLVVSNCCAQQPGGNSQLVKSVSKFQRLLERPDNNIEVDSRQILAEKNYAKLLSVVKEARRFTARREADEILISSPTKGRFEYELRDRIVTVNFEMTAVKPYRISSVSVSGGTKNHTDAAKLTWDNLEAACDQAAIAGFEGAVFVTRNGEVALSKAYGFANREKRIKNSTDTIYAVGSAPIDFTHAGILLLKDRNKLSLDDPITRFFEDVPTDKKLVTIRHLMTGASGLLDFHDSPSDKNHDHSWIDRDEAVSRILAQKLLFKPGSSRKHSHSAWGLLAAVIEVVSEHTYAEFTSSHLFEPAGMHDTVFFGDPIPENRVAVGYGFKESSQPNSPPNWGKTSWLVMGSGGQTSTLGDIFRWQVAIRGGKILSPESTKAFLGSGDAVHADGDMFGFEFMHSTIPDRLFMIISNTVDSRDKRQRFDQLGRQLHQLVKPESLPAKFSLGIVTSVDERGSVIIQQVALGNLLKTTVSWLAIN